MGGKLHDIWVASNYIMHMYRVYIMWLYRWHHVHDTGFYMYCPRHDNSFYIVQAPMLHLRVTKMCTKQQKPGFCPHYQKYIHLADVTTQGDAIMNALNVRKVNAYVNNRNLDISLIGLGMRLPLAMTFHFKVAILYNWKYWWSLNLAVLLQPGIIKYSHLAVVSQQCITR